MKHLLYLLLAGSLLTEQPLYGAPKKNKKIKKKGKKGSAKTSTSRVSTSTPTTSTPTAPTPAQTIKTEATMTKEKAQKLVESYLEKYNNFNKERKEKIKGLLDELTRIEKIEGNKTEINKIKQTLSNIETSMDTRDISKSIENLKNIVNENNTINRENLNKAKGTFEDIIKFIKSTSRKNSEKIIQEFKKILPMMTKIPDITPNKWIEHNTSEIEKTESLFVKFIEENILKGPLLQDNIQRSIDQKGTEKWQDELTGINEDLFKEKNNNYGKKYIIDKEDYKKIKKGIHFKQLLIDKIKDLHRIELNKESKITDDQKKYIMIMMDFIKNEIQEQKIVDENNFLISYLDSIIEKIKQNQELKTTTIRNIIINNEIIKDDSEKHTWKKKWEEEKNKRDEDKKKKSKEKQEKAEKQKILLENQKQKKAEQKEKKEERRKAYLEKEKQQKVNTVVELL